tara:strand:- start:807 stop:2006 length:1200 start_codon:yes stop_codon:yes gene_type:complete
VRFLFYFVVCFHLIISNSHSINFYKYPKKDLPSNFCKNLYDELNFPHPNYASEDPIKVKVDIYVDRIFEIEAHKNTFKAQVNLWLTWQDPRLKLILKKLGYFTEDTQKPYYLCSYNPTNEFSNFKLFDPAIEFFNRIDKPPVENYMADWVDVFSDGSIDKRLKDQPVFHVNDFSFKKFPFDKQTLMIELWSEYPSFLVEMSPNEPYMTNYSETGIFEKDGEPLSVDGWSVENPTYEIYSFVDNDGSPYKGFYLYFNISRLTSYYVYKIILPIIFILAISWSVFWVRGSQLEAKVNVTIVCLLSLIAYNFIIDEDLPKLPYLTFMDCFILLSYFYTGIATILCVYSFLRKLKSGKDLSVVDRYAQFIGPISYFTILLILLTYFYNLETAKGLFLGSKFLS